LPVVPHKFNKIKPILQDIFSRFCATFIAVQPSDEGGKIDSRAGSSLEKKKDISMPTLVKTRKSPYRALLLKKRDELLASTRRDPDALANSIRTADADEFAVKAADQDVAAATLEVRSTMLREINRSLRQLVDGSYGTCEGCGEEISAVRLKAIPWTRYCLACQEKRSRN
jgi:RNA polymerase-binding transcription factor